MTDNLPRGPRPMTGLWPNSVLNIAVLKEPVVDDAGAEFIMAWAAYLEMRKAQIQAWCSRQVADVDKAINVLAESVATRSLAGYVKTATGKKTLELPSGIIRVRVQRDVLRVYDEKGVLEADPTLGRAYQAPPKTFLDKAKLKDILKKSETHKMVLSGGDGALLVAELVPEVEMVNCQPNASAIATPNVMAQLVQEEVARAEEANDDTAED